MAQIKKKWSNIKVDAKKRLALTRESYGSGKPDLSPLEVGQARCGFSECSSVTLDPKQQRDPTGQLEEVGTGSKATLLRLPVSLLAVVLHLPHLSILY